MCERPPLEVVQAEHVYRTEQCRRSFLAGRRSGSDRSRARYDERARLVEELRAARADHRARPYDHGAEVRLVRAEHALEEFDRKGPRPAA